MKKRKFSSLAILIVILSFSIVIGASNTSLIVGAEGEPSSSPSTTKNAPEEPYDTTTSTTASTTVPTTTTTTTTSTTSTTAASTTRWGDKISNPFTTTTTAAPTSSTTKADTSETAPSETVDPSGTTGSDHSTTKNNTPSTTKKNNKTTKPASTIPKITVTEVPNTQIEGTVLDPLDAYFERLSGDANSTSDAAPTQETTEAQQDDDGPRLGTAALVAICLGGVAIVTCGITAVLAIRNKKQQGTVTEPEYDDEYDDYEVEAPADPDAYTSAADVDQTSEFTVVSLDDEDYRD